MLTVTKNYNIVLIDNVLQCDSCGARVMNYTPEFVKQLHTEYSKLKDFQMFIVKYNENPDLVNDLCEKCRTSKWRKLKHPSYSEYIFFINYTVNYNVHFTCSITIMNKFTIVFQGTKGKMCYKQENDRMFGGMLKKYYFFLNMFFVLKNIYSTVSFVLLPKYLSASLNLDYSTEIKSFQNSYYLLHFMMHYAKKRHNAS